MPEIGKSSSGSRRSTCRTSSGHGNRAGITFRLSGMSLSGQYQLQAEGIAAAEFVAGTDSIPHQSGQGGRPYRQHHASGDPGQLAAGANRAYTVMKFLTGMGSPAGQVSEDRIVYESFGNISPCPGRTTPPSAETNRQVDITLPNQRKGTELISAIRSRKIRGHRCSPEHPRQGGAHGAQTQEEDPPAAASGCALSDMMSLLLCFFVLLFSISSMQQEKFVQTMGSIQARWDVSRPVHGFLYPGFVEQSQRAEPVQRDKTIEEQGGHRRTGPLRLVADQDNQESPRGGDKEGIRFILAGRISSTRAWLYHARRQAAFEHHGRGFSTISPSAGSGDGPATTRPCLAIPPSRTRGVWRRRAPLSHELPERPGGASRRPGAGQFEFMSCGDRPLSQCSTEHRALNRRVKSTSYKGVPKPSGSLAGESQDRAGRKDFVPLNNGIQQRVRRRIPVIRPMPVYSPARRYNAGILFPQRVLLTSILETNLAVIRQTHPVGRIIQETSLEEYAAEVTGPKRAPTLASSPGEARCCCSAYDPLREAQRWAEASSSNAANVLVLGAGLEGTSIDPAENPPDEDSFLIVISPIRACCAWPYPSSIGRACSNGLEPNFWWRSHRITTSLPVAGGRAA